MNVNMFYYHQNNNHNKQQQNDCCCCCFRFHNNKHCPIVKNCDDYNNSINQQITLKMSNQLAQIISNNSDDYYDNNNNNAPKSPCYSIMNNYIHIPPIKLNFINYLKVASHHHHHQSFLNDDNNNNPNRFTNNETHKHSTAISVLFPILSLIFINPILSLLNLKKLIKMKLLTLTKPFFAEEKRINHRTPQFKQQQPPMQQRSSVIFYSNKRNKNKHPYLPSIHSNIANCISKLKIIILMMIIIIVTSMPATTITSSLFVSAQPYDPGTNTITRVINPGDKVDIPCSVVTPGGSVRWALNNKPIPLDSNQRRHWNISNDGKATLTINRVSKMDAGLWECWKLDSDFNIRQKVPIMRIVLNNVPEEPYLEYEGRLLLSPNNIISVKANNVIKINCIIKGMASMIKSIQWFVGQQNFTHQSRVLMEYSAEEDVSLTISVLTLNVSAKFHHEPLTCQIAHMSWSNNMNVTARFNVLYPPEFSIVREPGFGFPIIEGMDLILRCEIDANPMSPVRWERDSDPKISNDTLAPVDTSPDGTLIINGITTKDIGWYRCTTENELGFFASVGFFINVREATDEMNALVDQLRSQNPHLPSIPETSDDFHHRSSSDFAFRKIHDHSNRESHFQASRSNSPDFNNNNGYNNHQPQISRSDCSPTSGGSINNADGRPIIESINSTVIALVGSQITLIARFCCIPRPKKVYWIHRHLAMMPSRIIGRYTTRELIMSTNSMNCFTSNFIIDAVKPEDAGDVMFMVLNQKGIDNALVSLNVTMASYSISSSPSNGISSTSSAKSVTNSSSFIPIIITIIIMLNVILNYCNYFNHCIGLLQ